MNGLIPPGYQATLIGSSASIGDLSTFTPLEEGTAEGALMLMRLDFVEFPTSQVLDGLEKALQDKGVPPWPGYSYIVYADAAIPSVYLAWQKGLAWIPIIIGILATTLLPTLLGGLVWLILPQEVKSLISGLIQMGMMMLVMWLMTSVMKPLTATKKEKPKQLEEAKT